MAIIIIVVALPVVHYQRALGRVAVDREGRSEDLEVWCRL